MSIRWSLILLLTASLFSGVTNFTLQGTWYVQTQNYAQLQDVKQSIVFQFYRYVQDKSINGYMTITACRLLVYSYETYNNEIYFGFKTLGKQLRTCLPEELQFIRTHIDQTFYFSISNNILSLSTPNQVPPLTLTRFTQETPISFLSGVWTITNGIYYNKIEDNIVVANQTTLGLCKGKSYFNYKVDQNYAINFINNVPSQCTAFLVSKIPTIKFYRVNPLLQKKNIQFFDGNAFLVLELTYNEIYPPKIAIKFNQTNENKSQTTDNIFDLFVLNDQKSETAIYDEAPIVNAPTQPQTKLVQNNSQSIHVPNQPVPVKENNSRNQSINNPALTNGQTIQKQVIIQPVSEIKQSKKTITQNNTNKENKTESIKPSVIESQQPPSGTATSNNSSKLPTQKQEITPVTKKYELITSVDTLYGKWYPFNTQTIAQLVTKPTINNYQIIINAKRIFVAGGCNTMFSSYSFSNNSLNDLNVAMTAKTCPEDIDSLLKNILFNSNNKIYVRGEKDNNILGIFGQNGDLLLELGQNAPA